MVILSAFAFFVTAAFAVEADTFVDLRDKQTYTVVQVGTQHWLGSNLAYASINSSCYQNKTEDCAINERLYPWSDALIACPDGWRLPSDEDWMILEKTIGMSEEEFRGTKARGKAGKELRPGGKTGLNILMSGYERPDGSFARRGERAAFWVSTEANQEDAWHRDVRLDVDSIYRSEVTKTYKLSVRCIRKN